MATNGNNTMVIQHDWGGEIKGKMNSNTPDKISPFIKDVRR